MYKFRAVLGIVAGVIMILSAGAHTILGWRAMGGRLAETNAPADLVTGFKVGWVWGGPPMIVFGILAIATCLKRFRREPASLLAVSLIAVVYLAFGTWAFIETTGDPFFVIFIVPGVLLAIAAVP